ncbi:hypothetical protein HUA74_25885 [Myxococcus sp. CA051A]|uniref:Uncharacterized protein n=1 Tax=Myxococcus llanfairpwllgwyngyllgogerychwyrndrobwllllantysiliogogogochensis TaxID=2590453 RepID=A0A540WZZ2_9BACT|nr:MULTISPECIES: hypothetical protein [Myxococcus]NTX02191.1 hypothetical protein [Myxococcus sp. CA040A]NTX14343.1 hypothetical protein [Myxococcus sp. CA056]NTX36987.1 hypothetical protein [Myxococcus sp. CA033]NTX51394.1 hypothetical protein [Myxococcus sp. CA039A]NTX64090.1 hypothetical protein [Myxococcus sp. CA051A]
MERVEEIYQGFVVDHQLERAGLFELLRERFVAVDTVLYPGCFVHITPSFFFQHVVYVDRNDLAQGFFANKDGVLRKISSRQQYAQKAHVRFVSQDYLQPIPALEESFDLLLALYAGGISRACGKYLKVGGLLVTNDHHGDAAEAAAEENLELVAVVKELRGKYTFSDQELAAYLVPKLPPRGPAALDDAGGSHWARPADYYVFRKTRPGAASLETGRFSAPH